jgi:8-oxo-dGTP pyrophosphatase MutT (NUDIX family)
MMAKPSNAPQIVAALPVLTKDDKILVGLVTSRDTGRWLVPKGKLKRDEADRAGAEREAREEAGVIGRASLEPIACISIDAAGDAHAPLFLLEVDQILDDWPERLERQRSWQSAASAALMVDDPELITVLLTLAGLSR